MRKKVFETERLFLSIWSNADLPLAEQLWGNQQVTHFIAKNGCFSKEQVAQRLALEIESQKTFDFQYWPLFLKEGEAFIGCCGLHDYDSEAKMAELGFHLVPDAWGRGLAEEAAKGVISYATYQTDLSVLFAGHHPENAASEKLLRKLGFKFQGKEYYQPTGLEHPSYLLVLKDCSSSRVKTKNFL
ncbi:GNAT family N-acetyltransferase [Enterococcus sp. DIV0756]|uniref:GNAT family N-acetyltransferase n=1 Tax=Enterococcus sp. DIV0756 TaxID=2774636 RepID=UPI003F24635A